MGFVSLGLAIVLELLGTTFLKYTLGFTKLSPSLTQALFIFCPVHCSLLI